MEPSRPTKAALLSGAGDTQVIPVENPGRLVGMQALGGTNVILNLYEGTDNTGRFLGQARITSLVPIMFPDGALPKITAGLFAELAGTSPVAQVWYVE